MSTTPHIKFEDSPTDSLADSFISTPGTLYPPLFPPQDSLHATECMTPPCDDESSLFGDSVRGSVSVDGTPAPEKKPVKKRKSWGQQLPEPKTNLPPRYILSLTSMKYILIRDRKRAKTEDEKEQRRVERVLRNRRAAQSSRERKRMEVEALEAQKHAIERRNQDLEMRLADLEAKNLMLQRELEQFTGQMAVFRGSATTASPHASPRPVTFSQDLFGPRDSNETNTMTAQVSPLDTQPARTVNPASLSPEIRPVAADSSNASSSDLTQHPAAMLCDLQCQSQEQRPWASSAPATSSTISQLLAMILFISTTSQAISALLTPLSQIIFSLRAGSSLCPTTSILTTIMWLSTTTAELTTSTSTSSSTTTSTRSRPRYSLRVSLLNRLLACSPDLARPLMDATMEAMRSAASEQQLSPDCLTGARAFDRRDGSDSPSIESLATLLWATHVFERNRRRALELGTAAEARQDGGELGDLLRARELAGKGSVFLGSSGRERMGQKSLDDWCLGFKHSRP